MTCSSSINRLDAETAALESALVTVAETSFFALAEPRSVPGPAEEWLDDPAPYEVTVRFRGPRSGDVLLIVPSALALDLATAFLGLTPEEDLEPGQIEDLVGELANMVTGSWLSRMEADCCFQLDHPEVQPFVGAAIATFVGSVVDVNGHPVGVCPRIAGSRP